MIGDMTREDGVLDGRIDVFGVGVSIDAVPGESPTPVGGMRLIEPSSWDPTYVGGPWEDESQPKLWPPAPIIGPHLMDVPGWNGGRYVLRYVWEPMSDPTA